MKQSHPSCNCVSSAPTNGCSEASWPPTSNPVQSVLLAAPHLLRRAQFAEQDFNVDRLAPRGDEPHRRPPCCCRQPGAAACADEAASHALHAAVGALPLQRGGVPADAPAAALARSRCAAAAGRRRPCRDWLRKQRVQRIEVDELGGVLRRRGLLPEAPRQLLRTHCLEMQLPPLVAVPGGRPRGAPSACTGSRAEGWTLAGIKKHIRMVAAKQSPSAAWLAAAGWGVGLTLPMLRVEGWLWAIINSTGWQPSSRPVPHARQLPTTPWK